jgi:hypothetical protein
LNSIRILQSQIRNLWHCVVSERDFVMKALFTIMLLATATAVAQTPSTQPAIEAPDKTLDRMLGTAPAGRPLPPATTRPATNAATTGPNVAPGSPAQPLLREGTLLIDRTGRMMRSADGSQVEFVFDSDGKALKDPPVIILPNLLLAQMEAAAASVSRDLRFRITGMVTEYHGHNYVLLDKAVGVQDTAERF